MNPKNTLIMSLFLAVLLIGVAKADYSDYSVNMKVLSQNSYENTPVVVFGYITISDWSKTVPVDTLRLRIQKGDEIVKDLSFNELNYVNDIDNNNYLVDGFFYTKISDLTAGDYIAILSLGGEDVSIKRFKVVTGTSDLSVKYITFTDTQGPVVELNYAGSSNDHVARIYVYGRSNFNTPGEFDYSLSAGESKIVAASDVGTFNLNDYVNENQVAGLIVYGEELDSTGAVVSSTEPYVIIKRTGVKDASPSINIESKNEELKKGESKLIDFQVTNNGLLPITLNVQLSGSLSGYASTDINELTINPSESKSIPVTISIPRKTIESNGNLTISLLSGNELIALNTSLFTLNPADPVHSVIVSEINFTKPFYYNDEKVKGYFVLTNDGDYAEVVDASYGFEGNETNYITNIELVPGESKKFEIMVPAVINSLFSVSVSNDNLINSKEVSVNVEQRFYSFRFYLSDDHLVAYNDLKKNVLLVIENTGNAEDLFVIKSDYDYYELNDSSIFLLKPEEKKVINATISVPINETLLTMNYTVCSQNGDECKNNTLVMTIFNTANYEESSSEVNVSESTMSDNEVAYAFDVKNNNKIAKTYNIVYSTNDSSLKLSAYPSDTFVLQPGESYTVYLYANSDEDLTGKEINYAIKENGKELINDTLIVSPKKTSSLTGFAVAVGSVLGVAGLVVIILFIYFYFIKQPPQGGDEEFKPVEVKKADLTKPNVKNEAKYW